MKDNLAQREEQTKPAGACKNKKPYQKPAFRYERVFETRALACGKTVSSQGQCSFNGTKSS
jgi:hypothetical protein